MLMENDLWNIKGEESNTSVDGGKNNLIHMHVCVTKANRIKLSCAKAKSWIYF